MWKTWTGGRQRNRGMTGLVQPGRRRSDGGGRRSLAPRGTGHGSDRIGEHQVAEDSVPADGTASVNDLTQAWARVLGGLPSNQRAWLTNSKPVTLHESTAIVAVPDDFTRGQLETRLRPDLERILTEAFGRDIRIAVTVDPSLDPDAASAAASGSQPGVQTGSRQGPPGPGPSPARRPALARSSSSVATSRPPVRHRSSSRPCRSRPRPSRPSRPASPPVRLPPARSQTSPRPG